MVIGESAMKLNFFLIFTLSIYVPFGGAQADSLRVCLASPANAKLCEAVRGLKVCLARDTKQQLDRAAEGRSISGLVGALSNVSGKSQSVCSYTNALNSDAENFETQLQWLTTETFVSKTMLAFHGGAQ